MEITLTNVSQKKEPLPLRVLLGEDLSFGTLDVYGRLKKNEVSTRGFVAYNKDHIGRGIIVDWTELNSEFITVTLYTPTTNEEIDDFYDLILRIMNHWDTISVVDGVEMSTRDFFMGRAAFKIFNVTRSDSIFSGFQKGERTKYTMQCVMFPLSIGKEEAMRFSGHSDIFASWLHEKQKMDLYYAAANYYRGKEAIHGRYVLTEGTVSIFPREPFVPYGLIDPLSRKPLKCDDFMTAFYSLSDNEFMGALEYHVFMERLPKDKCIYFDCDHMVIFALTRKEIKEMIGIKKMGNDLPFD